LAPVQNKHGGSLARKIFHLVFTHGDGCWHRKEEGESIADFETKLEATVDGQQRCRGLHETNDRLPVPSASWGKWSTSQNVCA